MKVSWKWIIYRGSLRQDSHPHQALSRLFMIPAMTHLEGRPVGGYIEGATVERLHQLLHRLFALLRIEQCQLLMKGVSLFIAPMAAGYQRIHCLQGLALLLGGRLRGRSNLRRR